MEPEARLGHRWQSDDLQVDGKQYVSVYAGIGGWIGLPVAAGLDMNDKFGAIGATAMAKAAQLDKIPQGGTLYTFRLSSE